MSRSSPRPSIGVLDCVPGDTSAPAATGRWPLRRAAVGAAGVAVAGAAGDESEHRVLGQTLAGASPPNNLGFEEFVFDNVSDIEAALVGPASAWGNKARAPPPISIGSNEPK